MITGYKTLEIMRDGKATKKKVNHIIGASLILNLDREGFKQISNGEELTDRTYKYYLAKHKKRHPWATKPYAGKEETQ